MPTAFRTEKRGLLPPREDAIRTTSTSSGPSQGVAPGLGTDVVSREAGVAGAEAALGKSAQRLRVALANSPTTVFEQDLDLKYTWIFAPKLGYSAEEVIGQTDAELMDAAYASRLEAVKRQVIASGTALRERAPASTPGGPVEWYDLYVEPRRDGAGRIVGVICSATEITAILGQRMAQDFFPGARRRARAGFRPGRRSHRGRGASLRGGQRRWDGLRGDRSSQPPRRRRRRMA